MFQIPAFACLALSLIVTNSCGDRPDVCNISIPNINASANESIFALDIVVNGGAIQGMSNIPAGWQIEIENDSDWVSRIRANSTIGSASLAEDELKRLVFNVRRNKSQSSTFDVSGSASLSQTSSKRKLALTMEDFSLQQ
jgi:hypothetical protein